MRTISKLAQIVRDLIKLLGHAGLICCTAMSFLLRGHWRNTCNSSEEKIGSACAVDASYAS